MRRLRARNEQADIKVKGEKRDHATLIEDDEVEDDDEVTISEVRRNKRSRTSTDSGIEVIDLSGD